jgi:hypothetical protein
MKFSTALIFTTQILSVLGGKDNKAEEAGLVCDGVLITSGVSAVLCGTGVLATIFTAGAASPVLVACLAAAGVFGGGATACKGITENLPRRSLGNSSNLRSSAGGKKKQNSASTREKKGSDPEVCFDILEVGERCINSRDLVAIGTKMKNSIDCKEVGETMCFKEEFFLTCGSDKKWAHFDMCLNGTKCKKVIKNDKSIVCK